VTTTLDNKLPHNLFFVTVGNMSTALYDFDGQEGELSFKVGLCCSVQLVVAGVCAYFNQLLHFGGF